MARDETKKGSRRVPKDFIEWIENNYGPETAKWYKIYTGKGKAEATRQRINLSKMLGEVGSYHEGHGFGAKDSNLVTKQGGGPTTGRNLRPELGLQNVAHKELPRWSKEDMTRMGIPSNWLEDLFEADLEFHGLKVIGNPDTQAALDMDRGMPPEQAMAQSRMRDDLRAQGVQFKVDGDTIVDERITTVEGMKAPIWSATKQPEAPEFSPLSKVTGEPTVTAPVRGRKVPTQPIKFNKGVARFVPGIGVVAGLSAMGERAMAGDLQGAVGEGIAAAVGEIPIVGDVLVMSAEGTAAGAGSDITDPAQRQAYLKQREEENKFDPLEMALTAGQAALDNPMLTPVTLPIKVINGAAKLFGF